MDDDELTPDQAERVRRLLAEARHTEPMPDDVAARLDRVIAGLADDPDARTEGADVPAAPVVRLDERRRRAGRLLLAAAAVVVGGVAVGQLVGDGGAQDEASSPAAESADEQGLPAPDRDSAGSGQGFDEGDEELPGAVSGTRRSISGQPPVVLRSARFAGDARAYAPGAAARDTGREAELAQSGDALSSAATCPAGAWGGGRYVRVVVGKEAGWLVYRAPRGDTQVVDLFLCGTDAPERSATLPLD